MRAVHSSFIEREDWFYAISRTVTEHARGTQAAGSSKEVRGLCMTFSNCESLVYLQISSVFIYNHHQATKPSFSQLFI